MIKKHFVAGLTLIFSLPLLAREPQTSPPPPHRVSRPRPSAFRSDGTPGKINAITDVAGVEVGCTTLISGEGKLEVGKGPVRTSDCDHSARSRFTQRSGLRRHLQP